MLRTTLILAACLLLGAVVTIGVAWGINHGAIAQRSWERVSGGASTPSGEWLSCSRARRAGCEVVRWSAGLDNPELIPWRVDAPETFPRWSAVPNHDAFHGDHPVERYGEWHEVGVGWPMLALRRHATSRGSEAWDEPTLRYADLGLARYEPPLPPFSRPWQRHAIPIMPIWSGFILDTLFWGALVAVVLRGPAWGRWWVRHLRHRCPACGYPIGVSPVCTECGRAHPPDRGRRHRTLV
jgi:hypothetical protein